MLAVIAAIAFQISGEHLEVPAEVNNFRVTTTVKSGRKELNFLLDSGSQITVVSDSKAGEDPFLWGTSKIKARRVTDAEMPVLKAARVDGILGIDTLKNFAVGVDYFNGAIELWPKGATPEEGTAWVAQNAEAKTFTVPLQPDARGFFTVNCSVDGHAAAMVLDTGSDYSDVAIAAAPAAWLPLPITQTLVPSGTVAREQYLVPSFDFGGVTLMWKQVSRSEKVEEQVASPSIFASKRVLFDFKGSRVVFAADTSPGGQIEAALCPMLRSFVKYKDGAVEIVANEDEQKKRDKPEKVLALAVDDISLPELFSHASDANATAYTLARIWKAVCAGKDLMLSVNGDVLKVPTTPPSIPPRERH